MSILISAYMNENVLSLNILPMNKNNIQHYWKILEWMWYVNWLPKTNVDVEVQLAKTSDDFEKRIIFYNALLLANQDSFRKSYKKLHKAISLILCGFPLHKGRAIIDSAAYSLGLIENEGYLMEQRIIEQLMATGKADGISDEQAKAYLHLIQEGMEKGIAEGKAEGQSEGERQAKLASLQALTKKMSLKEAIDLLDMSYEEAQFLLSMKK